MQFFDLHVQRMKPAMLGCRPREDGLQGKRYQLQSSSRLYQRMAKSWTVTRKRAIRNVKVVVKVSLACSSSVETCEQRGLSGKFNLKCLPGVKNCTQKADLFSIAYMECYVDRYEQSCFHSTCNMNCSSSARECTQSEDGFGSAVIKMNCTCDTDVCRDCRQDS